MSLALLNKIAALKDWRNFWVKRGMLCVQDLTAPAGKQCYEIKNNNWPGNVDAIGCGGWDENDTLFWVGIDLDVITPDSHQKAQNTYETIDQAIENAFRIRDYVRNAAEIRLSRSGNGVHVRILIHRLANGRRTARQIAWWVQKQLALKCDHAVLGRQNFWFWAKTINEKSFALIESCDGIWTVPDEAKCEPVKPTPQPAQIIQATPVLDRAWKYIQKIPPSISGSGGHNSAFTCACALVLGFNLSSADAKALFLRWNVGCQPPWSEKEIDHKISQAEKQQGERGYLLKAEKQNARAVIIPTENVTPLDDYRLFSQKVYSGQWFAVPWPGHYMTKFCKSLLPGNIMLFVAPRGSGKSMFQVQCGAYWWESKYNPAILMIEDDRNMHLGRALAQYAGRADLADDEWISKNQSEHEAILTENADFMNNFGRCIYEADWNKTTDNLISWVKAMASSGKRVIVIDPYTAKQKGRFPWQEDHVFIDQIKPVIKRYETSLILVAHPPKTTSGNKTVMDAMCDDSAGGMALVNLTQSFVFLQYHRDKKPVDVMTPQGIANDVMINREIVLKKTRRGVGQGFSIGYTFDAETLLFGEVGIIQD